MGGDELHHGVEQQRWRDGLDEKTLDPDRAGLLHQVFAAVRREHDEARRMRQAEITDALRGLDPVHAAQHLPVEENKVIGGAVALRFQERLQRPLARGNRPADESHAGEHGFQDGRRRPVVFDHQYAHAAQVRAGQQFACAALRHLQRDGEPERAALARDAVHAHLAVHQPGKAPGNGETEARAAVSAGDRGIGLMETLEQFCHLCLGHAGSAVLDRPTQGDVVAGPCSGFAGESDSALLGELDGVGTEVDENLLDSQRVADQVEWHVVGQRQREFQALVGRLVGQQHGDLRQQFFDIELDVFKRELSRFDLGKIQDVIDEGKQVLAGGVHLFKIVVLPGGQVGFPQQVRHAHDRVHGGANLVAHVGHKIGLGLSGFVRGLPGREQFFVGHPLHGHVFDDAHDVRVTPAIADPAPRQLPPERRAVPFVERKGMGGGWFVRTHVERAGGDGDADRLVWRQVGEIAADQGSGGVIEKFLQAAVAADDGPSAQQEYAHRGRVEDRPLFGNRGALMASLGFEFEARGMELRQRALQIVDFVGASGMGRSREIHVAIAGQEFPGHVGDARQRFDDAAPVKAQQRIHDHQHGQADPQQRHDPDRCHASGHSFHHRDLAAVHHRLKRGDAAPNGCLVVEVTRIEQGVDGAMAVAPIPGGHGDPLLIEHRIGHILDLPE